MGGDHTAARPRAGPAMPASHPTPIPGPWFFRLATALDRRPPARRVRLWPGVVLARGRRAVPRWARAAGLSGAFRPRDTTAAAAGKRAGSTAGPLASAAVRPPAADAGRRAVAGDGPPAERYGPRVPGAGIHHNPAPGPAGSPSVYGPVWVALGRPAAHPTRGVVALPLLARLYV